MSDTPAPGISRQHDLDALRAFSMLLGIALHAALSFTGFAWVVMDLRPNAMFGLFYAAIHGFRLPLFFLISGYFTTMLWRRRGLKSLLKQRFRRVFLPCMIGLATIVPALNWASLWAIQRASRQDALRRAVSSTKSGVVEAVRMRDLVGLGRQLEGGADPNQPDPEFGIPPLGWAAMYGDVRVAELLLDRGAKVDGADKDGYRALHSAAFLGNKDVLELLLRRGADPDVRGAHGDNPRDSTGAGWETTQSIAGDLRVPLRAEDELSAGRAECRRLLASRSGDGAGLAASPTGERSSLERLRGGYSAFLGSDRFVIRGRPEAEPLQLFMTPFFHHLWFLWFLCWLVGIFATFAVAAEKLGLPRIPRRAVVSPLRWLWLLPITMIPQSLMGSLTPGFGPDTSAGILPQPHLLLYYGLFFGFGGLYHDADDREGKLGRRWWMAIPLALLIALPLALATVGQTLLSGLLQVTYGWAMTFGFIGLFRSCLTRENRTIRYLSDSAYWLYLAHLPFVVLLQAWTREWDQPSIFKFFLISLLVTTFLLVTYQIFVRYTWIGRLLNGPRARHPMAQQATATDLRAS